MPRRYGWGCIVLAAFGTRLGRRTSGGRWGVWSEAVRARLSAAEVGQVSIGLAHQNHALAVGGAFSTSTATFHSFAVTEFDHRFGEFPTTLTGSLTLSQATGELRVTAAASELGGGDRVGEVSWEMRFIGGTGFGAGLTAEIYLGPNSPANHAGAIAGTLGAPAGQTVIPNIHWSSGGGANGYPDASPTTDNSVGVNLFADAVPGRFSFNEDNYGVRLSGQIHIPDDVARGRCRERPISRRRR